MAVVWTPLHRADIITESQAKGLGNFVSKFALPALLFKNMVLLDFGDVIWSFLWSVLIAKVCPFLLFGRCIEDVARRSLQRVILFRWRCLRWCVCSL